MRIEDVDVSDDRSLIYPGTPLYRNEQGLEFKFIIENDTLTVSVPDEVIYSQACYGPGGLSIWEAAGILNDYVEKYIDLLKRREEAEDGWLPVL